MTVDAPQFVSSRIGWLLIGPAESPSMRDRADAAVGDNGSTPGEGAEYGGLVGSYPYAFRQSGSWLFRSYVVVGGVVTLLVGVLFTFAVVGAIAETTGAGGGTFTFARAFVVVVGFLVVLPLTAPVLLVARRHRRTDSGVVYDRALAASGYLFLFSLYLGLVPTTPPDLQQSPPAWAAPAVETLYGLPAAAGAVPPLVTVAVGYLLHRRYR
jgi:hypothetical protein